MATINLGRVRGDTGPRGPQGPKGDAFAAEGVFVKEINGTYSSASGATINHGLNVANVMGYYCLIKKNGSAYAPAAVGINDYLTATQCKVAKGVTELNAGTVTFYVTYKG